MYNCFWKLKQFQGPLLRCVQSSQYCVLRSNFTHFNNGIKVIYLALCSCALSHAIVFSGFLMRNYVCVNLVSFIVLAKNNNTGDFIWCLFTLVPNKFLHCHLNFLILFLSTSLYDVLRIVYSYQLIQICFHWLMFEGDFWFKQGLMPPNIHFSLTVHFQIFTV